jgi:hypothetical protein
MRALLELCGYTAYQAQCIAPWLWAMLAALGVYVFVHCTMWIWEGKDDFEIF